MLQAVAAAGRALLSTGVKGDLARTAASSLLSGGGGSSTRGGASLSQRQQTAGNSPIGQNPQG
jgi:hypothetical protein